MAEALVGVLLERLATIVLRKVEREIKLVTGVQKEVKNLTRNLEAIQAVLEDAEQRQVTEPAVRRWLSELAEVSFDMDDLLDEWNTELLKQQIEKQEKHGETALVITKKKVCLPFPSSCFCFDQVNRSIFGHDIARRIKVLNEKLDLIDKEKQRFNFQNTRRNEIKAIALPIYKTFGRDEEKYHIVSKLLSESSEGNKVPLIIPIVGMGGIGKTTLAQLVYNDENVKSHFDKRIWVCVSDPFEEIKISKAIFEGLEKENTSKNSNELQTLMQSIFELIGGKKFLLVLDGVWNPKFSQWEELIKPLHNGAMGSRVLVTTRNEEVATLMKATTQLIPLKELREPFCLSLFYYSAGMDESSMSKEFSDIGLKIVKRCNGQPLAVKTLGSLMYNKRKIREWQDVLNNQIWESEEIEQNIFRPLFLSYQDLAPAIKRCLLYCVIFPKDYVFDRDNLIELWMSQDYLNPLGRKEMEIIGKNYFDDLVIRSFFRDIEVNDENGKITCKIHDVIHDFLQYMTKNECLILDFEVGVSEITEVPNDKVRHLTLVHASESESSVSFLPNCRKLCTLTTIDSFKNSIGTVFELIVQLKYLRNLNLCHNEIKEIPKEIGELMHLRYLDLSDNWYLETLPDTMSSLYNLQTLRLANCSSLKKVDLRKLINLRHLYVNGCEDLKLMGIETLTHLQTLDMFYVQNDANNEGNKLGDLESLNKLQGQLIIKNVRHGKFAEKANMVNKRNLLMLCLEFRNNYPEQFFAPEEDREILNAFEPHPNLESLRINGYSGTTLSGWLSFLHSLRMLSLECCYDCEFFPHLGNLSSLESLYMGSFYVIKVGVEFLGIDDDDHSEIRPALALVSFPKLRKLSIDCMLFWEEWEGVKVDSDNVTIMPHLTKLTISKCNYLKALPDFLWRTPLEKLDISESRILQDTYKQGGEEWGKVSHIPNITV